MRSSTTAGEIGHAALVIATLAVAITGLSFALAFAAFATASSAVLSKVLFSMYFALSMPILLWRRLSAIAIGIDLFSWAETAANSLLCAGSGYGLHWLLTRFGVPVSARRIMYGCIVTALLVAGYILEGRQI